MATLVVSSPLFCACIYDAPRNDSFYRTLWSSDETPFESLTLEFLCDGYVSVSGRRAAGSYGDYQADGNIACFSSLWLRYDRNGAGEDLLSLCAGESAIRHGGTAEGSDGQGTGSEGQGTGSDGQGTGSEGQGTGPDGQGTGSDGPGTGSDGPEKGSGSTIGIIIEEGYRSGDSLLLRWHFDGSDESHMTLMTRRSSY